MSYNEPPGYGGTPPPPPGGGDNGGYGNYGGGGYGEQPPYGGQPAYGGGQPQQTSVMAIISLVTGILSVLCCTWFVFGIAAAVLGFLGKKEIDEGRKTGRGMAIAGLTLGIVSIVVGIVVWIVLIATDNVSLDYYSDL